MVRSKFSGTLAPIFVAWLAILLAGLFTSFGCSTPGKQIAVLGSTPLDSATPAVQSSVTPTPAPAGTPVMGHITLISDHDYTTEAERKKIAEAEILLNRIFQSACFFDALANRKLVQTEGRTPVEVATHLQSLSGQLPVQIYYRCWGRWPCTSAVAYRDVGSDIIHLNRAYFTLKLESIEWASTLGHEGVGHVLGGYGHDFKATTRRPYSVPYSINYAIEKCGKELK
jgi:hypothetical protein